MGYAIAKAAMLRGADVTLVSGRTSIEPPMFVNLIPVVTARDMYEAVTSVSNEQDIILKLLLWQITALPGSVKKKLRKVTDRCP